MTEPVVERLQAFLRTSATARREVVVSSGFTLTIDRTDPLRYLNYAIPDGDVAPTRDDIDRLRAEFGARQRLPRLEYLEQFAPRLLAPLLAAGMALEVRTPLMACRPDGLVRGEIAGLDIAAIDDAHLHGMRAMQAVAFGHPALADDTAVPDPRHDGGGACVAVIDGTVVAAAQFTPVVDGISEIVGVATAEAFRGRGYGGALTAAAAAAAFASGADLCVLSPGDDGARRVYTRAGFVEVAAVLHVSDPVDLS